VRTRESLSKSTQIKANRELAMEDKSKAAYSAASSLLSSATLAEM
jgi:hypothetical protein